MNAKLYTMEKAKKTGFPNYFKKIGISLIISVFILGIGIKLSKFDFNQETKGILKTSSLNLIIIGLSFISFAKDKIEDEMTIYLKLKSVGSAFIFGIIFVIVYPYVNLLFNVTGVNEMSTQQLIMTVLLIQITTFYGMKKAELK